MNTARLILSIVAALILAAAIGALLWYAGFVGLGILGAVTLLICVRVELERDGVAGNTYATDLYAKQIEARRAETRAERAAAKAELESLRPWLVRGRWLGAALLAVAVVGFFAV